VTAGTITYSYYDPAHGYGVAQTGATASISTAMGTALGTAVGGIVKLAIPKDRIVIAVTNISLTGPATGAALVEAPPLRTY
jgi:hypothetical protein